MALRNVTIVVFALLLAAMAFFSCQKEEIDNSDNDGYGIQLSLHKPGRNVELTWTRTNVSNFEQYLVARSLDSLPDSPIPNNVIATLDNVDSTHFVDASFPLANKVFYKIYAKIGDRFLLSQTVSVVPDVKLLDFQTIKVIRYAPTQSLYMVSEQEAKLRRYDYVKETVEAERNLGAAFFVPMAAGDNGFGHELYYSSNQTSTITIADALTLQTKDNFSANSSVSALAAGNGFVIAATSHWSDPLAIYSRSNKSFIDGGDGSIDFDRTIGIIPGSNTSIIEADFNFINQYDLTQSGQVNFMKSANSFGGIIPQIVFSPAGSHFLPNAAGNIMDNNLNIVGILPNSNFNNFITYVFSADGKKLFAFSNVFAGVMQEFSFPDLTLLNTTDLGYLVVNAFNGEGNDILVVGRVFLTFEEQTIVDKFEF